MIKVLFIGNSHTYYNDMPDIFRRIAKRSGREVFCVMLAHGGVGLEYHRNEPEAPFNILYGGYDFVVLQHRANPFVKETLISEGAELARAVEKSGAKGVLYMAWPRLSARDTQRVATEGSLEFVKKTGFAFAPAGEAFWKFADDNPDVAMLRDDGEHATKKGSFLAACTVYCAVFGERPVTDGEAFHEKCADAAYESYLKYKV